MSGSGRAHGFTLIELVVTVAIIGILVSAALPLAELTVQRAKEQELRAALRQIRTAIDDYKKAVDEGRIVRKADESGYPPSLDVLVEGVTDAKDPAKKRLIYFLRRVPRDPFADDPAIPAARTLGPAQLREPARRAARREGRVRRVLAGAGRRVERRALPAMVKREEGRGNSARRCRAFTLIELMVVMAIIATLLTIALPRYFGSVERSKEATLKQSLAVMRDAIDKFYGDTGRYPDALEELVTKRYIRSLPVDPITESATTWVTVAAAGGREGQRLRREERCAGQGDRRHGVRGSLTMRAQRGFTYVGLLLAVALAGVALAAAGMLWSTTAKRDKEAELLFVGDQFRRAIGSYYEGTPGAKRYPQRLADLLEDKRLAITRRHLRRIYADPMTGQRGLGPRASRPTAPSSACTAARRRRR